ncbi:MAG: phosphopantetheine-binding protein [Bacillota bacterium]|nr:phosphopantetheine-binding protein [Bacillota bacterium]
MADQTREQISGIVCQAIASADIPVERLDDGIELIKDLNMDSLALYELVIELEEHYQLQISDEDIDRLKTLDDIVSYIERKLKQA